MLKKRGVTLVALLTTISVMVILISVASISGITAMNNSKKVIFASELAMIQEAVNNYYIKNNNEYPVKDENVILDVSKVTSKAKTQFNKEDNENDKIILKKIDYSKIGIKTLKYGNVIDGLNDTYLLSLKTGNVYYAKGLKVGKDTYYTLNEDLGKIINYNINSKENNLEGIVFVPSTNKKTSNKINVEIKVPKNYLNVKIISKFSYSQHKYNDYDLYIVSNIDKNTKIDVIYNLGDKELISTFYVNNIIPKLEIKMGKQELMISSDEKKAYINFEVNSNDIKDIKYEMDKIPSDKIVSYFVGNGIKLNKMILPINKNVKNLTLYVEDKYGNYVAEYIEVEEKIYNLLNEIEGNGEIK